MTELVDTLIPWVAGAVIVMLLIDVLLTIIKLVRGPSVLSRALAADLLVSSLICAVGAEMVLSRHSWSLPMLVTLALIAFVGTVAVSRFVARDSDDDGAAAARERHRRQELAKKAPKDRDPEFPRWLSGDRKDAP
ncbi:monovalent cation/H+ antiporter complex subunit F [Granulicoccus sp. GXG6511]|uniref:monovalent cation/H+ antiporter complex subunit F n=1 Tax=Granulicoccus sp. GXG6511 TaxID=3381351 RepID=UPI003D7EBE4A